MITRGLVVVVWLAIMAGPGLAANPWSGSIDERAETRFIPVQLWSGSSWNGARTLTTSPADLTFGSGRKRITGPTSWTDPHDQRVHQVYTRTHIAQNKVQLFAVTNNGATLGRVYDSRYNTVIRGGAKFPLGVWHRGETQHFDSYFVKPGGRGYDRRMTISIVDLNHPAHGIDHCLSFRWMITKPGAPTPHDDNTYTYCPGKGLVAVEDN